jgi:hypothetical protein
LYISKGNLKLQGNSDVAFFIFNLPSRKTCPGATPLCQTHCYAQKAERQYPAVLPSRERNYNEVRTPYFKEVMVTEIRKLLNSKAGRDKKIYFRIHESGDFFSDDYFVEWLGVMHIFPDIKFLAFTKSYSVLKYILPDNFNLFFSVWADTKDIPTGIPLAFTGDMDVESKLCTGFCSECLHCFKERTNVRFKIH